MVERPIKKSERQQQGETADAQPRNSDSRSSESRPAKRENRSGGRGKRRDQKEEPKQAINPALMRGPKPVKPQPQPEPAPEEQPEATEETQEAEATEA